MDLRVDDNHIIPLLSRIAPGKPITLPFPIDNQGRFLAYTIGEQTEITRELDKAGIGAIITPEPQPDPAILAACQGKVTNRSQALAALAAGKPPVTLESLAAEIDLLKQAKASAL